MRREFHRPVLLDDGHELEGFECRSEEQTNWLRQYARQSSNVGTTRVFVVTPVETKTVVAFFAWCMASISVSDISARARLGGGRYPQPVALLARLGVSIDYEGLGLGAGLLQDVIARTHALGEQVGCRGLVVHAETTQARDFYLPLVPEFESSPTDDLHLILLMKDIRRTIG